jgi:hypothetical protein
MQMGKSAPGDVLGFFDTDWSTSLYNLGGRTREDDQYEHGDMSLYHAVERDPKRRAFIGQFEKPSLLRPVTNTHWRAPALSGISDPLTTERMSTQQFKQAWQDYDQKLSSISDREIAIAMKIQNTVAGADRDRLQQELKALSDERQSLNQGAAGVQGRLNAPASTNPVGGLGARAAAPAAVDPAGQLAPQAAVPAAPQGTDPALLTAIAGLQADFKALVTAQTTFINRPQLIQAPIGAAAPPAAPVIVHVPQPIPPETVAALRNAVEALTMQRLLVDRDAEEKNRLLQERLALMNRPENKQGNDPARLQQVLADLERKIVTLDTKITGGNNQLRDQIQAVGNGIRQAEENAAPLPNQIKALQDEIRARDDSNRGVRDQITDELMQRLTAVQNELGRQRFQDPTTAAAAQLQAVLDQVNASAAEVKRAIADLSNRPPAVAPAAIARINPTDLKALATVAQELKAANEALNARVQLMPVPQQAPDSISPALDTQINRLGDLVSAVTTRTNVEKGIVDELINSLQQASAVQSRVGVGPRGDNISSAAISEIGHNVKELLYALVTQAPLERIGARIEQVGLVMDENLRTFSDNQIRFGTNLNQVLDSVRATEAQVVEINTRLGALESKIRSSRENEAALQVLAGQLNTTADETGVVLRELVRSVTAVSGLLTSDLQATAAAQREVLVALGEVKHQPVFLPTVSEPATANTGVGNDAVVQDLNDRIARLNEEKLRNQEMLAKNERLLARNVQELGEVVDQRRQLNVQLRDSQVQLRDSQDLTREQQEQLGNATTEIRQLQVQNLQIEAELTKLRQALQAQADGNAHLVQNLASTTRALDAEQKSNQELKQALRSAQTAAQTEQGQREARLDAERQALADALRAAGETRQVAAADAKTVEARRKQLEEDQRAFDDARKVAMRWDGLANEHAQEAQQQLLNTQRVLNQAQTKARNSLQEKDLIIDKLNTDIQNLESRLATLTEVNQRRAIVDATLAARAVSEAATATAALETHQTGRPRAIRTTKRKAPDDLAGPALGAPIGDSSMQADDLKEDALAPRKRGKSGWHDGSKRVKLTHDEAEAIVKMGDDSADIVNTAVSAVAQFTSAASFAASFVSGFAVGTKGLLSNIGGVAKAGIENAVQFMFGDEIEKAKNVMDMLSRALDAFDAEFQRGNSVSLQIVDPPRGKKDTKMTDLETVITTVTESKDIPSAKVVIDQRLTRYRQWLVDNPLITRNLSTSSRIESRSIDFGSIDEKTPKFQGAFVDEKAPNRPDVVEAVRGLEKLSDLVDVVQAKDDLKTIVKPAEIAQSVKDTSLDDFRTILRDMGRDRAANKTGRFKEVESPDVSTVKNKNSLMKWYLDFKRSNLVSDRLRSQPSVGGIRALPNKAVVADIPSAMMPTRSELATVVRLSPPTTPPTTQSSTSNYRVPQSRIRVRAR